MLSQTEVAIVWSASTELDPRYSVCFGWTLELGFLALKCAAILQLVVVLLLPRPVLMQGYFLCPLIFAQCLRHGEQGLYNPFLFCLITHSRFLVTRTKTNFIAFLHGHCATAAWSVGNWEHRSIENVTNSRWFLLSSRFLYNIPPLKVNSNPFV